MNHRKDKHKELLIVNLRDFILLSERVIFISFVFIYKKTQGLRIVFQTSAYLVCKSLVKVCVFVQRVNCGILSIDL